jgi:lipoprotein
MNLDKFIILILTVMFSFVVSSCDKNDSLLVSPEVESSVEPNEVVEKATTKMNMLEKNILGVSSSETMRDWFSGVIRNWSIESTGNGVVLLKKKNDTSGVTYLIVANLQQGAKVRMLFDPPLNLGTENAKFYKRSLVNWNNYGTFFAIANSSFFDFHGGNPCTLPFPLKKNGIMYSLGNGGSNADHGKEKAVLNVYDTYADIVPIGTNSMQYQPMANCDHSCAGFYENTSNGGGRIGRTLMGIKDLDGDGFCEYAFLLVASKKTQPEAYNLLKYGAIACDKVITFDGGDSSQLICRNSVKVSSSRPIPVCVVIKGSDQ